MLSVVLHPAGGQVVDLERVNALIRSIKPAHVRHQVSVEPT